MHKTITLAATLALLAAPALAANKTPQTNTTGPGSAGSTQQQDMNKSQTQSDQNAQAPAATYGSGTTTKRTNGSTNPQQNPHGLRKEK